MSKGTDQPQELKNKHIELVIIRKRSVAAQEERKEVKFWTVRLRGSSVVYDDIVGSGSVSQLLAQLYSAFFLVFASDFLVIRYKTARMTGKNRKGEY